MTALRVALGQFDVHAGDPPHNLRRAAELAAEAARGGAALLVLPEMWATGYDLANNARHVPHDGSPHLDQVIALARRHGLAIAGSLLTRRSGRYYNTATLVSAAGEVLLSYDKMHLFRLMDEHRHLQPGTLSERPVSGLSWEPQGQGVAALAVCYDLRFPELFRRYAAQGAELVIIPAEWPLARVAHWRLLLQARAVENQCFVVGVNRVGQSDGTTFGGHSLVCGPWGTVHAEGGEGEEVIFADLELEEIAAARARLPVLNDRRPELWPAAEPALA